MARTPSDDSHDVLDTVRIVMQPHVVVGQTLTSILFALLAASSLGQRALGVHPIVVLVAMLASVTLYLATYAWARYHQIRDRWPLAELNAIAIVLGCAALSAPSRFVATPAYAMVVNIGFILGLIGGPTRGLAWTLAAGPLVMRAALAPQPSRLSLAISVFAGLTAWGAYRIGARIWEERVVVRRALQNERERFAAARHRVAELALAMSLHDGVTGLFMALQQRLRESTALPGLEPALRRAVDRIHEALRPLPTQPPLDWADTLAELGAELDVTVRCCSNVALDTIVPALRVDLWAIVWEATANALAHGESPVEIELTSRVSELLLVVVTPSRATTSPMPTTTTTTTPPTRAGAGLGHIRLLADCWGGIVEVTHDGEAHRLRVAIPTPTDTRPSDAAWRWLAGPVFGVLLGGIASAIDGHLPMLIVTLLAQVLSAAMSLTILQQYRKSATVSRVRASRAREVEAVLERCREALQPLVARLESAIDHGDLANVRRDIDALFTAVSTLTRTLENAPRVDHSSDAG